MNNYLSLIIFVFLAACVGPSKKEQLESKASNAGELTNHSDSKEGADTLLVIPSYDFDGLQPLFEKNNDTTYVINFWATWCKPCIKELPAFEKLNKDYANKKVKVILTSIDFPDKIENQVIPFIQKNNIKSTVVHLNDSDANSWIPKVSEEWSGAIPATLIYNKKVRKFYERSFTFQELETEVINIL